ncbi:MAG: TetR/AcrR family transcriptional regulator [Pseudonocardiaceae bacterium]
MPDRRTEILDGALHVLAERGMRGLTHRAVDAATGIPAGSTSYYFRTRSALVTGCVARLLEIDLAFDAPAAEGAGTDALVDGLTGICVQMATAQRHRTLARYELSLAATRDPEVRTALVGGGDTIRTVLAGTLAAFGAVEPDVAAAEVAAALDGMMFTALVRGPHDPGELAAWLRPALHRILHAQPGIRDRDILPSR